MPSLSAVMAAVTETFARNKISKLDVRAKNLEWKGGRGRRGLGHVLTIPPPTTAEAGVVSDDFFASVSSEPRADSSRENSSV